MEMSIRELASHRKCRVRLGIIIERRRSIAVQLLSFVDLRGRARLCDSEFGGLKGQRCLAADSMQPHQVHR